MTRCYRTFLFLALAAASVMLGSQSARAEFALNIQTSDGGNVTIYDGSSSDLNPLTGGISYVGVVGGADLSLTTGVTNPIVGSPNDAEIEITSIDVNYTGSGTLTISLSNTGYDYPLSPGAKAEMVSSVANISDALSAGTSFTFQSYADSSNTLFGTSGPSVTTTGQQGVFTAPVNSDVATTSFTIPTQYSLTDVTTIQFGPGGGNIGLTGSTQILAPEPATMAMTLSTLPLIAFMGWKRRRARS